MLHIRAPTLLINEEDDDPESDSQRRYRAGNEVVEEEPLLLPPADGEAVAHQAAAAPVGSEGSLVEASLPTFKLVALGCYWFSLMFYFISVLSIVLPAKTADISPAKKASLLGALLAAGAGANTFMVPLIGAISDSISTPFGKRKPFLFLSTTLVSAGLLWLPYAESVPQLFVCYFMLAVGMNSSLPVYFSMLPDNVPVHQRGAASGWSVLFFALGSFCGGISVGFLLSGAGYSICSYIVSGVLYGGVITLILFAPDATITARRRRRREAKQHITISESRPWSLGRFIKAILLTIGKFCYGYFKPFFMRDFMFAWLSTGFYYTGTLSLTNFMQYYYTDAFSHPFHIFNIVSVSDPESAMSVYTGVNVAGTIFSSLFAGRLIDSWFGYRASISLGALLVASGMGTIAATTIFEVTLVGAFLVGCGTGFATTAQMALNSRVLSKAERAEDSSNAFELGVMSNNTNMAQILATFFNGYLLDFLKTRLPNGTRTSYIVVDCIAIAYMLLAVLIIWRVRGVH